MAKTKTGTVNLYGEISSWSWDNNAVDFIKRLKEAAVGNDEVVINVHCLGGEVFDGNMICNAIASLGIPVDANIEGVCASMASVIVTCCRSVSMADNAFLMIHAPSSSTWGDAEKHERAAKLLRSIEKNMIAVLVKKTGKAKEDVAKWFTGENWFSAQEALDEKLINEIYTGSKEIEEIAPGADIKQMDYTALYKSYRAAAQNIINQNKTKKPEKMDKQSLINRLGLTGVTAQSSDADIEAAIEAQMKAPKTELEAIKKQQITNMVEAAVAAKKITEAQKDTWQTIGETSGADALKKAFDGMKAHEPQQTITDAIKNAGTGKAAANRSKWDWDRWQKEDPRGLEKMKSEDAEQFQALYEAKYVKQ